jgi:hypothetical protein
MQATIHESTGDDKFVISQISVISNKCHGEIKIEAYLMEVSCVCSEILLGSVP